MKSLVAILGLLVAAVQAAPGERFSVGPTPLNIYMTLREGAPKVQAPKIINGYPAVEGQFPYQAALVVDGATFCGGSLISPSFVLTAAQCAQGSSFQVILGRLQWNGVGGLSIVTSVKIVHSGYVPSTFANDIALLDLPYPVDGITTIRPVALPAPSDVSDTFEGRTALISGYGLTTQPGTVSQNLNWVDLLIISNFQCSETYGSIIQSGIICASGAGGKSPCNGDSGSPLVVESGTNRMQIGIVSFIANAGCASGYPSGYTRVTYYMDWIRLMTGLKMN